MDDRRMSMMNRMNCLNRMNRRIVYDEQDYVSGVNMSRFVFGNRWMGCR